VQVIGPFVGGRVVKDQRAVDMVKAGEIDVGSTWLYTRQASERPSRLAAGPLDQAPGSTRGTPSRRIGSLPTLLRVLRPGRQVT